MDTTRDNFEEALPQILEDLEGCDFVAIDFEMTGIGLTDPAFRTNYGDTPQERYAKMRPVASRYNIIQLGLCTFTKEKKGSSGSSSSSSSSSSKGGSKEAAGTLVARPYNIYTCADEGEDVCLSLSAITFLRGNNMDFNTWLSKGCTFLNASGEEALRGRIEQERERDRQKAEGNGPDPDNRLRLTRQSDKDFVEAQIQLLANWYAKADDEDEDDEDKEDGGNGNGKKKKGSPPSPEEAEAAARRKKELPLSKCNAFLRRALFEAVQERYPELVTDSRNGQVLVLRLTEAEKRAREEQREKDRQARFDAAVGVRHVFKAIGACGKPLVVHNGMYDLMFFMDAFHGPLPPTLHEFKAQLRACFPNTPIYDTKFYASALEDTNGAQAALADSTVEGLYNNLVVAEPDGPGPRVRLAPGFEKYEGAGSGEAGKEFAHEAGYDAYLTGAIFARMRALGADPAAVLAAARGRVFNYRSLFGTDLGGEDVRMHPNDHVFHLGIAPAAKGVKTDDLMKLFGENSVHCIIYWIDDRGAWAVLKDTSGPLADVVKGMGKREGITVTEFSSWYAAKRAAEAAAAGGALAAGAGVDGGDVGMLAWVMKRTLNLIGWGQGGSGREKRMRAE